MQDHVVDALQYASAGWKVLPVGEDKRPLTSHGVHDATTDLDWIRNRRWPAIATPTGDGLLVIDIDPRNGGEFRGWMPSTRCVRTQSGGYHLHYRIDRDIKSRANLFGPGIDSKSAGGYVLVPPSPGYTWKNQLEPTPISADYLERYVNRESFPNGATGGATRVRPQEWRKGMIHDQVLAWAAYLAGDSDMSERDVVNGVWDLINAAREHGTPIDNAGQHIDKAIAWVLSRERANQ